ncbi:hypothetical protein J4209_06705 [Candidatus Woesearchaeota archaeon]|nr:hypothetical protein [Candidatus Woesearchaeota archaeon]
MKHGINRLQGRKTMAKNYALIHAVPSNYKGGLSLVQLAHVLRHFSAAVNHPRRKVFGSSFVNVDEDGIPHIIHRSGSDGKPFKTVDEAVAHLREQEGNNLGVVIAAYDTKSTRLRGKSVQEAEVYDIPHVYHISGGMIGTDEHYNLWRLYQFFHTAYKIFSEALPGMVASSSDKESVSRARGTEYFEQDWLHHFVSRCNHMRFEMLGPGEYKSARFFEPGGDPITAVREVMALMEIRKGFADRKKAFKAYTKLGKTEEALKSYQPEIEKAIGGLSLATIKPYY